MARPVRLLVTDPVEMDIFEQALRTGRTTFTIDYHPAISPAALEKAVADYDGVILRSRTELPRMVLERSRLRYIGRAGNGLDNIDRDAAAEQGIHVDHCPDSSSASVAELVFAEFLALSRHLLDAHHSLLDGEWRKHETTGHDLAGKTLGIIGLGAIGSEVALRGRGFGMNLFAHDPFKSSHHAASLGVTLVGMEELLVMSDYLSVHVRLTENTRGLLGEREMSRMKEGVYLVNTSREWVLDTNALVRAVVSAKIAGYATDVFSTEPPAYEHPVLQLARDGYNVLVTPHIGAQTVEAQERIAEALGRKAVAFFDSQVSQASLSSPGRSRGWRRHLGQIPVGYRVATAVAAIALSLYAIRDAHHCDQEGWNVTPWDTYVVVCPHRPIPTTSSIVRQ